MFQDMRKHVKHYDDDEEICAYLRALLHKEAFDRRGLIYGMGHAVYSISRSRATIFKGFVEKLAKEKGREKDFKLYSKVEELAPKVIGEERHIYKGVSANVDFYSGFVYSMLDLPLELYTPVFAIARIVGWSAHRMEELINTDKIIRPAYKNVKEESSISVWETDRRKKQVRKMEQVALILEGGANRGIFTAGVLDFLMDQDFRASYVVGVSAGACNALGYVSEQRGRTRDCILAQNEEKDKLEEMKRAARTRSLFDMDQLFDRFPNGEIPFDYGHLFFFSYRM